MNIKIDISREYLASPNLNSSREMSVNSAISSIDYADQVQVQTNNLTQAEQVENGKVQSLSLFYAPLKEITIDTVCMEPTVKLMHVPYAMKINNANTSQCLKPLVILYQANQPVDP